VTEGRPPWEWTDQEVRDAALWNLLGAGNRAGLKPPPSYGWTVPPVPGSASDIENAWRGTSYFQGGE
jgi:hypothetical protein